MLSRHAFIGTNRAPAQLGVLATYLVSISTLAFGVSVALWLETQQSDVWIWLIALLFFVSFEVWLLWKPRWGISAELLASAAISLVWAVPIVLWFADVSPDSQLLLVVFLVLVALSGVLLKRNGPLRSLMTVGVALPFAFLVLWRSNAQAATYASLAILAAWMCMLCLGWLIGWSSDQRRQFLHERKLLLENLELKMSELDRAKEDEQKARVRADQASRDKSKFLAMVSHDLRQPIYAANLMLDSLQQDDGTSISQTDVSHIQSSLMDLSAYLETLLDSAMLDSGEMTANPSVFSLDLLARQLRAEYVEMAAQHGIEMRIDLPPVLILTDPILLSRVLRNLISNAIYHSEGRSLNLSHSRSGETITLHIEDDGKGLPDEIRNVLRAEDTDFPLGSSKSEKGRGLGLSIVSRLCALLDLDVQVQTEQTGTRFDVGALQISGPPEQSESTPPSNEQTEDKTVIIVDDDEAVLDRLKRLLGRWGYRVHATTGKLPCVANVNLLIADLDLSTSIDGVDVIAEARERWGMQLPAFIITGNTSHAVTKRVQDAGLRLVHKPVHPAVLKSIILTELSH